MPKPQPEPHYLTVGRIVKPHGIRGELVVEILTDAPEHIAELGEVYVGPNRRVYPVEHVRFHKGRMLLRLQGCDDRNTAEMLRDASVQILLEMAQPLEEDEFYTFQLLGLEVETDEGEVLGELVEILDTQGANDVYVVHGLFGEVLLPAIADVIVDVDLEAGRMVVHLLPGLLDAIGE
jgi:16S rRNA processing protein RimM